MAECFPIRLVILEYDSVRDFQVLQHFMAVAYKSTKWVYKITHKIMVLCIEPNEMNCLVKIHAHRLAG